MRIRQVKPAFWTDGKLARLTPATRLFYVGTWMLADDAGWLDADPTEMGAELYPFETPRTRERRIAAMLEELGTIGCLEVYDCGHAHVPHLVEHQRLAGPTKRFESISRAHRDRCPNVSPRFPAVSRGFPRVPASRAPDGQVRSGKELVREPAPDAGSGEDDGSQEITTKKTTETTELSEFRARVPALPPVAATGRHS